MILILTVMSLRPASAAWPQPYLDWQPGATNPVPVPVTIDLYDALWRGLHERMDALARRVQVPLRQVVGADTNVVGYSELTFYNVAPYGFYDTSYSNFQVSATITNIVRSPTGNYARAETVLAWSRETNRVVYAPSPHVASNMIPANVPLLIANDGTTSKVLRLAQTIAYPFGTNAVSVSTNLAAWMQGMFWGTRPTDPVSPLTINLWDQTFDARLLQLVPNYADRTKVGTTEQRQTYFATPTSTNWTWSYLGEEKWNEDYWPSDYIEVGRWDPTPIYPTDLPMLTIEQAMINAGVGTVIVHRARSIITNNYAQGWETGDWTTYRTTQIVERVNDTRYPMLTLVPKTAFEPFSFGDIRYAVTNIANIHTNLVVEGGRTNIEVTADFQTGMQWTKRNNGFRTTSILPDQARPLQIYMHANRTNDFPDIEIDVDFLISGTALRYDATSNMTFEIAVERVGISSLTSVTGGVVAVSTSLFYTVSSVTADGLTPTSYSVTNWTYPERSYIGYQFSFMWTNPVTVYGFPDRRQAFKPGFVASFVHLWERAKLLDEMRITGAPRSVVLDLDSWPAWSWETTYQQRYTYSQLSNSPRARNYLDTWGDYTTNFGSIPTRNHNHSLYEDELISKRFGDTTVLSSSNEVGSPFSFGLDAAWTVLHTTNAAPVYAISGEVGESETVTVSESEGIRYADYWYYGSLLGVAGDTDGRYARQSSDNASYFVSIRWPKSTSLVLSNLSLIPVKADYFASFNADHRRPVKEPYYSNSYVYVSSVTPLGGASYLENLATNIVIVLDSPFAALPTPGTIALVGTAEGIGSLKGDFVNAAIPSPASLLITTHEEDWSFTWSSEKGTNSVTKMVKSSSNAKSYRQLNQVIPDDSRTLNQVLPILDWTFNFMTETD